MKATAFLICLGILGCGSGHSGPSATKPVGTIEECSGRDPLPRNFGIEEGEHSRSGSLLIMKD